MANLLEDFGRSGSTRSLQQVTGVAVQLGQMQRDAARDRASFAIDLAKMEKDTAFRSADLELRRSADLRAEATAKDQRAAAEQDLRKKKMENDELQKRTDWLNKRTRVDLHPAFLSLQPETQKFVIGMFQNNGMLNEKGEAENRSIAEVVGQLESSSKLFGQFNEIELKGYEKSYLEAFNAYQAELGKGTKAKPEKVEELKAEMTARYGVYQTKKGNADKSMEVVMKREEMLNKLKEEKIKAGAKGDEPAKVGTIGQVNRELVTRWFDTAKENARAGGSEAMEKVEAMLVAFNTTDQFGGTVNDARIREVLSPEQKKAYDWQKERAQNLSKTMNPAAAVTRAQTEWNAAHPAAGSPKPPAGFEPAIDEATGKQKTSGGKPVWVNKKTNQAWVP